MNHLRQQERRVHKQDDQREVHVEERLHDGICRRCELLIFLKKGRCCMLEGKQELNFTFGHGCFFSTYPSLFGLNPSNEYEGVANTTHTGTNHEHSLSLPLSCCCPISLTLFLCLFLVSVLSQQRQKTRECRWFLFKENNPSN